MCVRSCRHSSDWKGRKERTEWGVGVRWRWRWRYLKSPLSSITVHPLSQTERAERAQRAQWTRQPTSIARPPLRPPAKVEAGGTERAPRKVTTSSPEKRKGGLVSCFPSLLFFDP